jgi:hypothetical protein
MSASGPSPAPDSALPAALQARLDYLFRHHVRDDSDAAATATLRHYLETYRRQTTVQDGTPA